MNGGEINLNPTGTRRLPRSHSSGVPDERFAHVQFETCQCGLYILYMEVGIVDTGMT